MADFKLPDVGEGIESGIVVSILVKEGDSVEVDQAVIELETDKAVVEVPSNVSGVVEAVNVKENDEVKVGQTLLSLGDSGAASATKDDKSEEAKAEEKDAPAQAASKESAPAAKSDAGASDGGSPSTFKLPELGEGIDAGTVVAILVKEGDSVELDQPVIELETDKAVLEVPSGVSGVVQSIAVKVGDEASVGQSVLSVSGGASADTSKDAQTEAKADKAKQSGTDEGSAAPQVDRKEAYPEATPAPPAADEHAGKLIPAAPSVRRLAREMGVPLREVAGSGIMNRISADDVRRYAQDGNPAAAPTSSDAAPSAAPSVPPVKLPDFSKWGEVKREPMSGIRKATVRAMTQAWGTVPMVTHFDKADITDFEAMRKQYKPKAEAAGASLTPTAMLLKIVAGALKKFPDFNASIDSESNEVIYKDFINIGVAVDTPNGLLVPVIKNADQKNIIELAAELGELAGKARDRKLSPDEMQGGNFNVSNLGGIGGTNFTPIVNPPQVAILGVSRGRFEPVWDKEKAAFIPRMLMPISLTYDHRLIDGAAAAKFSKWLCAAIEEPFLLMLEG